MLLAKTVLSKILPQATILEAGNGREAVTVFSENSPDLVFMDIHMAEMNGFEASAAIRALEPEGKRCPIVAMTADSLKEILEQSGKFGIDDCVIKPYTPETVLRTICHWLAKSPENNRSVEKF